MKMKVWVSWVPCIAILIGCGESTAPVAIAPLLEVRVTTTGTAASLDPDGYSVEIGGASQHIEVGGTLTINDVAPGKHSVKLSGVAANCSVGDDNPRSVEIGAGGGTVVVTFLVTCLENSGTLQITTITTGSETDSDGYRIVVVAAEGMLLDVTTVANGQSAHVLRAGTMTVRLQGVAANCVVTGGNDRAVNIAHALVTTVMFETQCQTTSSIEITTATTGVRPDTDGYNLELRRNGNFSGSLSLPSNGVKASGALVPGDYTVRMWGINLNCSTPFSGTATVNAGDPTRIRIDVTCVQPLELAYSGRGPGLLAGLHVTNALSDFDGTIVDSQGEDSDPAWSPDGRKLAFTSVRDENIDIYVADADGSNRIRLTHDAAPDYRPAWSRDGTAIAFVSERDGNAEIYMMAADGTKEVRLTTHDGPDIDPAWAPDGWRIAFARGDPNAGTGIFIMAYDEESTATRLSSNPLGDAQPAWSPDGSRIVFTRATATARSDLYLINADGSSLGQLTDGYNRVADPDWSPDGKLIAFSEEGRVCNFDYSFCPSQIFAARMGDGPGGVTLISKNFNPSYNPSWRPVR